MFLCAALVAVAFSCSGVDGMADDNGGAGTENPEHPENPIR